MATVVAKAGPFVQITTVDADWIWTTTFPRHTQGIKVDWIAFKPGATNDKLSLKMDSDAGVECFPAIPRASASDGQIIYYYGNLLRPMLDLSASTLSSNHQITIKMADNSGD